MVPKGVQMKHILVVISLFFSSLSFAAGAHRLGAGLILGNPTGLSGKYLLDKTNSIDGAVAWNLSDDHTMFHIHSDYLWQVSNIFKDLDAIIDLFYGVGLRFVAKDPPPRADDDENSKLGPRLPVGLRHMFRDPRIEVFVEIALIVNFIPSTDIDLDLGIGGRYYF